MGITYNQLLQVRQRTQAKKLKRPAKWLFPHNLERKYKKLLHKLTGEIRKQINAQLKPIIPSMLSEVEATYPNQDSGQHKGTISPESGKRSDGFLDVLRGVMASIENSLKPLVNQSIIEMQQIGNEISNFNQQQFEKVNYSVFGMDIFVDQPWLLDQLELFSRQNAQLITSLPEQELFQVSGIVERALVEGQRFSQVSTELQKRYGITRRRANLIGRDQTSKLNASLTRLRQQSAGVEEYIWQTSGDERVRPTHKAHDGKKFRWDDPPADTGHPGTDINCRCVAIPVMEGIIE